MQEYDSMLHNTILQCVDHLPMQYQLIKLSIILFMFNLIGCINQVYKPPLDVSLIPNDCANRVAIINWLDENARVPQQAMESKEEYERSRGQIRSRIWSIRYNCQPV